MATLRASDWRQIAVLSAELFEMGSDLERARTHLLHGFASMVGGAGSYLVAANRQAVDTLDPLHGWRVLTVQYHGVTRELATQRTRWLLSSGGRYMEDPLARSLARQSGRARVVERRDVVASHLWERTPQYNELERPLNISGRLVVGFPLARGVELYYGVDQARGDRSFTGRAREVASTLVGMLRWFHLRYAFSLGLHEDQTLLTPREHDALLQLLSGQSEKQIADHLGLTHRSLHQVVVAVYRKLKVASRAELMGAVLGGQSTS